MSVRKIYFLTGPGWVLKCISFWHSNLPYFKKSILVLFVKLYSFPLSLAGLKRHRTLTLIKAIGSSPMIIGIVITPAAWIYFKCKLKVLNGLLPGR